MARNPVRIVHVSWRDGRPRFEPGPALRAMGYEGKDLKDAAGRWLEEAAARRFSDALVAEIVQKREAAKGKARAPRRPARSIVTARLGPELTTVEGLFDAWFQHPSMRPGTQAARQYQQALQSLQTKKRERQGMKVKAPATVRSYKKFSRLLSIDKPEIWVAAAGALDLVICFGAYEDIAGRRGLAVANGIMRTLAAALSFGMRRGLVPLEVNPAHKLGMTQLEPRLVTAEPAEIDHLVAAADLLGRPEMGDAIMLGVWTAQRQADRLQMFDEGLLNGRRYFRQQKTGRTLSIPESPQLSARLAAARERRRGLSVQRLELVINERDNEAWRDDHFRHVFAAIVKAAAFGVVVLDGPQGPERVLMAEASQARHAVHWLPGLRCLTDGEAARLHNGPPMTWLIRPMPTLEGLQDKDLRTTAVTWLARAQCSVPEIAAITGHSLETANTILRHYLARHPEMADHAIAKLVAWHG